MTPEQLVPSLELCQRAQRLGWKRETIFYYVIFNYSNVDRLNWVLVTQLTLITEKQFILASVPAPTLQEVLEELDVLNALATSDYEDICSTKLNSNPAEEALELWCEIQERKMKDD